MYFGLIAAPSVRGSDGGRRDRRDGARAGGPHDELEPPLGAGRVRDAGADQVGEAALDPLAREVVRHGEDEACRRRGRRRSTSPNQLRKVFSLRVPRSRADTSLQRLSAVSSFGCSTPSSALLRSGSGGGEDSTVRQAGSMRISGPLPTAKSPAFAGRNHSPHDSPQVWKAVSGPGRFGRTFHDFPPATALWTTGGRAASDYTGPSARPAGSSSASRPRAR